MSRYNICKNQANPWDDPDQFSENWLNWFGLTLLWISTNRSGLLESKKKKKDMTTQPRQSMGTKHDETHQERRAPGCH